MAIGRGAVEAYLDVSPTSAWDRDVWDEYDAAIDIGFHAPNIHFTPLINYVNMPVGADNWYTGNELLPSHTNINPIGLRQHFIDAMYVKFGVLAGQPVSANWVNSGDGWRQPIASEAPQGERVETTCLQASSARHPTGMMRWSGLSL